MMETTPAPSKASRDLPRFGDVDVLRALAMSMVIAQHAKILPFGWMGVWLFYVISGFVVTSSLISRPIGSPGHFLGDFYTRRAARILPIYLLYIIAGLIFAAVNTGVWEWNIFSSLLLFYNNVFSALIGGSSKSYPVGHLWTISTEMQFYLIYGPLFTFLSRRTLVAVLIGFALLAPCLRLLGGVWLQAGGFSPLQSAFAIYVLSPMHFDSFAAGALLALAPRAWRGVKHARWLFAGGLVALSAYALVFVWINHLHGAKGVGMLRNVVSGILFGDTRQAWLYSAVALLGVGTLALTLTGKAPWTWLARNPALQWVGRVSYGGYLYHPLFMILARQSLRRFWPAAMVMSQKLTFGVTVFAVALPLTILVASVSYQFLERPIIGAVNRRLTAALKQR